MDYILAESILGQGLVRALCWTLVHSIWQGLLLALIAGIFVLATKKSSPVLRYNFFISIFFLFLAMNAITLAREINAMPARDSGNVYNRGFLNPFLERGKNLTAAGAAGSLELNYIDRAVFFLNEHATTCMTIWFIIFCLQFGRLLISVGYMQRIRRHKVHSPALYWQNRLQVLARGLGLTQRIELLQSELIRVPMMAGYLKPVILFPFSMMMQLPKEQVEAILLHELAHIRRKDFFVNMLQQLAGLIYFFNPGLLWLSSLISEEREHCCDDLAIGQLGQRRPYISALMAFQDGMLKNQEYALAFPGRKNHLFQRIKRIVYRQNQSLNTMEKIFLAGCLLIITVSPIAFSQTVNAKVASANKGQKANAPVMAVAEIPAATDIAAPLAVTNPVAAIQDTVPPARAAKAETYTISKDDKITYVRNGYKIVAKGDHQIIEVYYHGKKLTKEEIAAKKAELEKLMHEQDAESALARNEAELAEAKALADQAGQKESQSLAELYMAQLMIKQKAELLHLDAMKSYLQNEQPRLKEINQKMADLEKQLAELQAERFKLDAENQSQLMEKLARTQYLNLQQRNLGPIDQIIEQLLDKKIINDRAELSFELNSNEFIVNKARQSAALHKEFKDHYLKGPEDHVIYSASKHSVHSDVSIKD